MDNNKILEKLVEIDSRSKKKAKNIKSDLSTYSTNINNFSLNYNKRK